MAERALTKRPPNSVVIEMSSVTKLKDALIRTERIVPEIPDTDDKVPSWDGAMRLYSSAESFNKDNICERIPVQVKGTWVSRFSGVKATFQADTSDLRNYMHGGGIIFFLIQIKDFDSYKIFYASLLPFDLRRLLDEAGNQRTKSIKLDIFPHKYKNGILHILADFRENKKKQAMLLPNIRSINDIEKAKTIIDRFEISIPGVGIENREDLFEQLLSHPQYVYAKPANIDLSFAVDKIQPKELVFHRNNPVRVNGEVLYNQIDVVRLPGRKQLFKLGTDVTISFTANSCTLNYTFQGTLSEQIREIKLIIGLFQKSDICIGEKSQKLDYGLDFHGHTFEEALERQIYLFRIDETLKKLHVKKDLNLGELTKKELLGLNYLVEGILDEKPVLFNLRGKCAVGKLTLGNINVILSSHENPNGQGVFIRNFFDENDLRLVEKGKSPEDGFRVSPYVFVKLDSLRIVDNIDFNEIVKSIKSFPYSKEYGSEITFLALELLKLFDEQKKSSILDIAIQLIEYLQDNDNTQSDLYQINLLQTEKRRRKLSMSENQYLMTLKVAGIPLQYQLAASILLESFSEAQVIFDRLEETEKEIFLSYPIMNLWPREK